MSQRDLRATGSEGIRNFLEDRDGFVVGFPSNRNPSNIGLQNSSSVVKHQGQSSITSTIRPALSNSSSIGTVTSSRRPSDSELSSLASSSTGVSSSISSILSQPPSVSTEPSIISTLGLPPVWDGGRDSNYDYTLPCEFREIYGCLIEFHPQDWQHWVSHTKSHFVGVEPPTKSSCIFCDVACGNPFLNWFERMDHIREHHMQHARYPRPDYFVIEHLYRSHLLEENEYELLMRYSERPHVDGLVSNGFKTDEMKRKERLEQVERYDLEKERRVQKKERRRQLH